MDTSRSERAGRQPSVTHDNERCETPLSPYIRPLRVCRLQSAIQARDVVLNSLKQCEQVGAVNGNDIPTGAVSTLSSTTHDSEYRRSIVCFDIQASVRLWNAHDVSLARALTINEVADGFLRRT